MLGDDLLDDKSRDIVKLKISNIERKKIKKNPKCVSLYIHKPGPLPRNEEYLKELGDVYKRGLLEVDGFIQEYIKQEGENDDL